MEINIINACQTFSARTPWPVYDLKYLEESAEAGIEDLVRFMLAQIPAGGPSWDVGLGRFDSLTASKSDAEASILSPSDNLSGLTTSFSNVGLSQTDLVAFSGNNSGVDCITFRTLAARIRLWTWATCRPCRQGVPKEEMVLFSRLGSRHPNYFDNSYYSNLLVNKGLLNSDQVLDSTSGAGTQSFISSFGGDHGTFFSQFAVSMIKMGAISPKSSSQRQIRTNCRVVNSS
ncbi:hypothetical protein R1sor_005486 [Riccia sorocarpa]|uniref:Plant heme peroxidase family profile domain-containing protein n=1 Tax=Riccia sorocarpa TaxID=122646 RepID=A0ABD3HP47_9MARC